MEGGALFILVVCVHMWHVYEYVKVCLEVDVDGVLTRCADAADAELWR